MNMELFPPYISAEERLKEFGKYLQRGEIQVLVSSVVQQVLKVPSEEVISSLLFSGWVPPSRDNHNRLLARGSSMRSVTSTTLPLMQGGAVKPLDVVIKKADIFSDATRELDNLDKIWRLTNIRLPLPIAVLSITRGVEASFDSWVITRMEKAVVPIERISFETFIPEQRRDFLEELAEFAASLSINGVIHNDLHFRNIGYDFAQRFSRRSNSLFVLFDPESSIFIPREELHEMRKKKKTDAVTFAQYYRYNQLFTDDTADLIGDLKDRGLTDRVIEEEFIQQYLKRRVDMRGYDKDAIRKRFIGALRPTYMPILDGAGKDLNNLEQ